ncbi:hypothetical protein SUGI_1033590 [Cryptomeria japonica]|uniref:protein WVD2-like 2 n=1 Tax=Cryptomeria japonica TaxID=3369 RepID=UPI0024149ED9|nr:protein WVD2-like 2 [Cryptomeria japonica]GLJ48990.1 hypothetical protein SUGI_1033590 [Cryptomeria japonica]
MTEIEAINAVISTQGFSKSMLTGEDESHKMEKETFLHGISSDDRVTQQSSNIGNLGKENLVFDANKEETTKGEMLEECFESEETSKKKEAKEARAAESSGHANGELHDEQQEKSKVIADKLYESKLKKENNLIDKQNRLPSYQRLTHSRSLKTGNSLLGKSDNMTCQSQNSRLPKSSVITTKSSIQSGKDRVLAFTNKGSRAEVENVEVTSATSKSPLHNKISLGSTKQNHTVPQPFTLATDKRASFGSQQTGGEAAQKHFRRASTSNVPSPAAGKKQLTAKSGSGVSETKISHSIVHKPPTSTEASKSRTNIVAASTVTVSRCNERAQKRKEFNAKLEEKLHAKEEEKRQLQAKTKEQQEEQLKKMRRSLSFKANPVPDFYHEAIPPKLESKKIPPTHAKSPNLGQRKNSIGFEPQDNHNEHGVEHTNGDHVRKTHSKVSSAVKKTMPNVSTKTPTASSKKKSISRELITPKQETLGMPENGYSHASTEIGNVITGVVLHSSESPTNEEKRLQQGDYVKQENEVEPLNRQSMMLDSNIEIDLTLKSENHVAVDEIAALIENLQVSVDSK